MNSHTNFSSSTTPVTNTKHLSKAELHAVKTLQEEYHSLLQETEKVQKEMILAQHNFDYFSGKKDIDACIFRIRTSQCRYESLLARLQDIKTRINNIKETAK